MRSLGMLPQVKRKEPRVRPVIAQGANWVRAPESGILWSSLALGARVSKDDVIGRIAAPLMNTEYVVRAPADGILIGRTHLPLVYEGEALFHVARFHRVAAVAEQVEALQQMEPVHPPEPGPD